MESNNEKHGTDRRSADWKKHRKRILILRYAGAALFAALLAAAVYAAFRSGLIRRPEVPQGLFASKRTVRLWYSDKALDEFLTGAELYFNENSRDLRLDITYAEEAEFLEQINRASIQGEDYPDLYIIGNDQLEMAYLAGLVTPVENSLYFDDPSFYPEAAVNAVTYSGIRAGWPMYFDTAALVYDPALLGDFTAPGTVTGLIDLSNNYIAPANVRSVFEWDVNDIFYNYGFIGDAMDVGGVSGDDPAHLSIYDRDVLKRLMVYQQLASYFSIDAESVDYETVINDFLHGRTVFTLATTDILSRYDTAALLGEEGLIAGFGTKALPDVTDTLRARGMSVTYTMVINGYCTHPEDAQKAAGYILYEHMGDFYAQTGKLPAARPAALSDPRMDGFYEAYAGSVPITKMREMGNFWMLTENMLQKVWGGEDPEACLYELYEQCMLQIGRDPGTITRITDPEPVDIRAELTGGD